MPRNKHGEELCDCCELPIKSCGRALEQRRLTEVRQRNRRVLAAPGVIEANFGGRCPDCSQTFHEGDPIARNADGLWSHCAADAKADQT